MFHRLIVRHLGGLALVARSCTHLLFWTVLACTAVTSSKSHAALLGTAFAYQGELYINNVRANGFYDFEFVLFDVSTGGSSVAAVYRESNVEVVHGILFARPDFGNAFKGEERWMEVRVRPHSTNPADPYTTLLPRVELLPAPYSLSLRPGAEVEGAQSEPTFSATNTNTAIFGSSLELTGIHGRATGAPGESHGVWGENAGAGVGVYGSAPKVAVQGVSNNASVGALLSLEMGVLGVSRAPVESKLGSPLGAGVWGENEMGYGVFGKGGVVGIGGESTSGTGVKGVSFGGTAVSGRSFGEGTAVDGRGASGLGVYGSSTTNHGVRGFSHGQNGVFGESQNSSASGVYGENRMGGYGVAGRSLHVNGVGLLADNTAGGVAFQAYSTGGHTIQTFNSNTGNRTFFVDGFGNVRADGTFASPAADFAELLPSSGGFGPGDVLAIGADGRLALTSEPFQSTVAGVFSTRPAFLGGAIESADRGETAPVAVIGIVPVKVCDENGSIRPGDLLVSSSGPGQAMRAGPEPPAGTVIGKALGTLLTGSGLMDMLVSLH